MYIFPQIFFPNFVLEVCKGFYLRWQNIFRIGPRFTHTCKYSVFWQFKPPEGFASKSVFVVLLKFWLRWQNIRVQVFLCIEKWTGKVKLKMIIKIFCNLVVVLFEVLLMLGGGVVSAILEKTLWNKAYVCMKHPYKIKLNIVWTDFHSFAICSENVHCN